MKKRLTCALYAAGMLLLAGCASSPRTEYYTLRPDAGEEVAGAECQVEAEVTVAPFTAAEPYGREEIVYRRQPYRVYFDNYRRWTSPPAQMLEQECAAWLRKSGLFSSVTGGDGGATYAVEGHVLEFYELDRGRERYAVVHCRLSLVNAKGTTLFTISPRYRVKAPPAEDWSGVAEAMSGAVRRVMKDFVGRTEEELCSAGDAGG